MDGCQEVSLLCHICFSVMFKIAVKFPQNEEHWTKIEVISVVTQIQICHITFFLHFQLVTETKHIMIEKVVELD